MLKDPVFIMFFGVRNFKKVLSVSKSFLSERIFAFFFFFFWFENLFCFFFELGLKSFIFWNIRESSISRKKRKFRYARVLNIPFLKYKKSSVMLGFWIILCWNLRKFNFLKYKNFGGFFVSWSIRNLFGVDFF